MRGGIAIVCTAAAVFAAAALHGCGRKAKAKPPLIGVLMVGDFRQPVLDGLQDGLTHLGYPPGTIEYRIVNASSNSSALPRLADELAAAKPGVLCPLGDEEASACAASAAGRIPIVFMNVNSPIGRGLVKSYRKPPPNVTGVRTGYVELTGKRLQVLTFFFPKVKTVSVVYEPGDVASAEAFANALQAASSLGLQLKPFPLRNVDELRRRLRSFNPAEHEAIFGIPATLVYQHRAAYLPTLARLVLGFGFDPESAALGTAVSYGSDPRAFGASGAELVKAVLDGKRPGELPIRMVESVELCINRKSLQALGLSFPPEVEALATEVFE